MTLLSHFSTHSFHHIISYDVSVNYTPLEMLKSHDRFLQPFDQFSKKMFLFPWQPWAEQAGLLSCAIIASFKVVNLNFYPIILKLHYPQLPLLVIQFGSDHILHVVLATKARRRRCSIGELGEGGNCN